jgi:hypothetical protein
MCEKNRQNAGGFGHRKKRSPGNGLALSLETSESATIRQQSSIAPLMQRKYYGFSASEDGTNVDAREDFLDLYTTSPTSFAATYPDVPVPDPASSPHLLAARWTVHDLYGEDMPRIAADLLEAGHDTPTIRRLAGEMNVRSSSDVESLMERLFRECAVRYPLSQTEAKLTISRQIAREVIAGIRNPWAAANKLEIAIWGWHAPNSTLGAIFGINGAIDIEPKYRPSLETLRNELLDSFATLACLADDEVIQ